MNSSPQGENTYSFAVHPEVSALDADRLGGSFHLEPAFGELILNCLKALEQMEVETLEVLAGYPRPSTDHAG